MYSFNPTVFELNSILYSLVRHETNIKQWLESTMTYTLHKLDNNNIQLSTEQCEFHINGNIYKSLKRNDIGINKYMIEDIKYFYTKNNTIYCIANVLVKNSPRLFRVGIIKLDIEKASIHLVKLLSIETMKNEEKNWTAFYYNNVSYIIYTLFPNLILYSIDDNFDLHPYTITNNFHEILSTPVIHNLSCYYSDLYLTACMSPLQLSYGLYLIYCKKKTINNNYEYYYCILRMSDCKLFFLNTMRTSGLKLYLNSINTMRDKIYECYGLNDSNYKIITNKIEVCLHYFDGWHNFGDELSLYITQRMIDTNKYNLIYNESCKSINMVCIGSYIQEAKHNSFVFGTGIRTSNNIENGHKYKNLIVCAVRGPHTRDWLIQKGIFVPEIYGDPALLLPKFYKPNINKSLSNKIGIVPHFTQYKQYLADNSIDKSIYYIISPSDDWEQVINAICSCKAIVSSSLHGIICSDAYGIPNLWLDEYPLDEGDFKFNDYFASQHRDYTKISKLTEYKEELLYTKGNTIDLDLLMHAFPFQ